MPTAGSPSILSIDLGTSAVKLALITTRGSILAGEEEPIPLSLLPEGGAEQDPESWWSAIVRATRRLLERAVTSPGDIVGVNVGSQWSGTVAVDEQGRPLRPAILWMDSRGARHVQRLARGFVSIEGYGVSKLITWLRLTGGAPSMSGKDPLGHILWLQSAKTKAAIDAMRNAQKNMGSALGRIEDLERALRSASATISTLKGYISPNVYQYGSASEKCTDVADKAISAIAKVLG